jgi:hypothetical protein
MRDAVERLFDKRIRDKIRGLKETSRDELLRASNDHPNRGKCIDSAVVELRKLKLQRQMTKKNFVDIVFCCADLYCSAVVEHLKQRILTAAEVQRRTDEANRMANLQAEFDADQKELEDTRIKSFPGAAARRIGGPLE